MSVPAPSDRRPWAGRRRLGEHGPPWTLVAGALGRAQRGLLHAGKALVEPYVGRKRSRAVAGERLAEAMMRYADLCMSADKTPRDREEAARFLDHAAALYMEIGRPEKAAAAQALKAEARLGD